jgi:hypothetical protein
MSAPAPTVPATLPGQRLVTFGHDLGAWMSAQPWHPALATAAMIAAALAGQWAGRAVHQWRHRRLATHAQQVLILPPPLVEPGGAGLWWANLAGLLRPSPWRRLIWGAAHIALEYRWSGRQLQIIVWVPATVSAGPIAAAARAAWPGASTRIEDATDPLPPVHPAPEPAVSTRQVGAALVAALPPWYPLATAADQDSDPLRALMAAGADLHASETACVQILARVAGPRRIARARAGAAALKTGQPAGTPFSPERLLTAAVRTITDLLAPTHRPGAGGANRPRTTSDPLRERDARPGLDKLSGPQWEVAIRIGVAHTSTRTAPAAHKPGPINPDPRDLDAKNLGPQKPVRTRAGGTPARAGQGDAITRRLTTQAHALASALAVHDARNRLRRVRLAQPSPILASRVLRSGFLLSAPELAALAGLPLDVAVPGLDRARAKAVPAPIVVPTGGRNTKVLGRAQVGGHSVALPVADAREHLHVLGSTGVGKSTLMTHLILGDIRAWRPTILIDPKGDLARDVLDRLPVTVADRLVLIDPDQPVGSATFNPLELRPGADADLIADNIVSIFSAIFQRAWGPRIDDVVRVSCLTLMRYRNPTLANVAPLLNDKQFRAPFTVDFDDPAGLKGFWQWYESTPPHLRAQVIGPVLARLRSFLLRDFVRATIGPYRSSFDMQKILDEGGILIARLPKGQLGEDTSRLLGSLIFASVWQAATARARLPETQRRDAGIYIDEAHNILNLSGTVSDMLAEARGYHLSMVLAHQHLAQLPRDTQLALSANARSKIFFNCSPEDAVQLARHTLPELDDHDVAHLDAYIAAARLVIGNRETAAFTLATNPPPPVTGDRDGLRAAIAQAAARRTQAQNDGDEADSEQPPPAEERTKTHQAPTPSPAETPHRSRKSTTNPTRANPQAGDQS